MDEIFKNICIIFLIHKGKSHKSRKSHKSHKSHPTNPWDGICGDGRDLPNSDVEALVLPCLYTSVSCMKTPGPSSIS